MIGMMVEDSHNDSYERGYVFPDDTLRWGHVPTATAAG